MSAARAFAAIVDAGVELRAERGGLRVVGRRGALSPELWAELPAVAPALLLVVTGQWREQLDGWPLSWRQRWLAAVDARLAEVMPYGLAEQLAFLDVAELPDEAEPLEASPPAAPPAPVGIWRAPLARWPEGRRELWTRHATFLEHAGHPRDLAEHLAFRDVASVPYPPPACGLAPCPECGALGQVAACGLGSCTGCGWVPRLDWPWPPQPRPQRPRLLLPIPLAAPDFAVPPKALPSP